MKNRFLCLIAIAIGVAPLRAQEPEPLPSKSGTETPLFTEPESLIPPGTSTPRLEAAPKSSRKKFLAADELKERIRFRQVQTRALHNPAVIAEKEHAAFARTDAGKREALRNYYNLLYAGMLKIEPTLSARVTKVKEASLRRLAQRRVRPDQGEVEDSSAEF
jgi:hypothetical protein